MSKASNIIANVIDIAKKLVTYDKSLGIITNGVDNLYPERVDRFINNSVTAKTCARIMTSYLQGKGWGEVNDKLLVNEKLKITLQKLTNQIANSTSKQRGVFIHVGYNGNFAIDSYTVLPYKNCRLGKKDDDKYNGKIGVSDRWEENNIKKDDITFFDVFNNDPIVVAAQVNAQKGDSLNDKIKHYKGQILYVNLDEEYVYALSSIDSVMKDCDSEAQASTYKNRFLRKGYMGQKMLVTKPMVGAIEDYSSPEEYHQALGSRDAFKESVENCIGADNNGGILVLERSYEDDSLDDLIKVIDVDSGIKDDTFKYTEESVFNNILMAFNSIPSGLVRPVNSLFGQSSAAIEQMQLVYQNNLSSEINEIEQLVQYLMSIYKNPVVGLELLPLIEKPKTEEDAVNQ